MGRLIMICENCNYIKSEPRIKCKECPYGKYGECGAYRCPTIDEWNLLKYYFKEKYNEKN